MKIAMMTNNYKPFVAGVPISIERLTESLRAQGHEVVVFAPDYEGQEEETDVIRYKALIKGVSGGFSVPNSLDRKIEHKFREGNFDLIHVHHPMMIGRTALYLSQKYQVPLVFTYHTRYEQYLHYIGLSKLRKIIPAYIRNYTRSCDLVLAPTLLMKDYLKQIQVGTEVKILPTGLPESSFQHDKEKAARLREQLAGDKKYLFCTVARLAEEKNLTFLLRCMKRYKDIKGDDFRLALVGDGPKRKELKKLTDVLGLEKEVIFVGKAANEEIKNYCHAADLFLFSSLTETQGIVLLESMAAGTPVLALKATGTEDVVVNGKNGYMTSVSENAGTPETLSLAEMEFTDRLMDILEKKEIDILRQGALETARNYDCGRIAHDAAAAYIQAIEIRRRKERLKYHNRNGNQNGNMVYS